MVKNSQSADHRLLQWLKNMDNPSMRFAKWLIIVRQFDFKIEFLDEHKNAAAVALSRFCVSGKEETNQDCEPGILILNI